MQTVKPFGFRGRDSAITWLRQYQYNLHSPLQPGVVKALLLVLRSSAALALAAVAPLGVAQFIRMRTARSAHGGARNRSAINRPQTAVPVGTFYCLAAPMSQLNQGLQTAIKKQAVSAAPLTRCRQAMRDAAI